MKLTRNEQRVLCLAYNRDGRITIAMVRKLGLRTTAVPQRLVTAGLLRFEPFCEPHLRWTRTSEGSRVARLLAEKRVCDWCDERAVGSTGLATSTVSVYFCEAHERTARRLAKDQVPAFEKANVGNAVFGKSAVSRATKQAAAVTG